MSHHRTRIAACLGLVLALVVLGGPRPAHAHDDRYDSRRTERSHTYNDEYIFSTTRMVSEWDVNPAIKVPFFPPAIVIDLVFLPAELVAGLL
jgi:hypothetical protein